MRFHLRVDTITPRHIHLTVFANGANAGRLCFTRDEGAIFIAALRYTAHAGQYELEVSGLEAPAPEPPSEPGPAAPLAEVCP